MRQYLEVFPLWILDLFIIPGLIWSNKRQITFNFVSYFPGDMKIKKWLCGDSSETLWLGKFSNNFKAIFWMTFTLKVGAMTWREWLVCVQRMCPVFRCVTYLGQFRGGQTFKQEMLLSGCFNSFTCLMIVPLMASAWESFEPPPRSTPRCIKLRGSPRFQLNVYVAQGSQSFLILISKERLRKIPKR